MRLNSIPVFFALAFSGLLALLPNGTMAQTPPNVTLPANITLDVEKPGADVAPEISAFAGKWGGTTEGGLPVNLIVERVGASGEARGVYAWGTSQYVKNPGASKIRAKIEKGTLSWGDPVNGTGFELKMRADGKLVGERYVKGAQDGAFIMTKMQ